MPLKRISLILLMIPISLLATSCENRYSVDCKIGDSGKLHFDSIRFEDAQARSEEVAKMLGIPEYEVTCLKELF